MDNLTHTLVAASMGKAGLENKTRFAIPALLISANLPDIEIFSGAFGLNYFDYHRAFTHSFCGICLLSSVLAVAFWLVFRLWERDPAKRLRLRPIWIVCLLGMASHMLLDLLNDYGIRPWLPFNARRYYGDLLPVTNPWLWLLLGAALYLSSRSYVYKIPLAAIFAVLALASVYWGGEVLMMIVWLLALGLALWAGSLLMKRSINVNQAAICACILYIASLGVARAVVLKSAREFAPAVIKEKIERIDVLPRPRMLWTVIVETGRRYYIAEVRIRNWRDRPPHFDVYEKNLDQPWFREAHSRKEVAAILRFARFPSAFVTTSSEGRVVTLRDLRYSRDAAAGFGAASVVLGDGI
jgi:membrane-bound metal-dependent hydrolase YbcI (DUF457 family)